MRILYLFPYPIREELAAASAGKAPSDRMYGVLELRRMGHTVDVSDSRWTGWFGRLVRWLRSFDINIADLGTIRAMRRYDVVVIKDGFSLLLTWAGRLIGAQVVYLDCLFALPRRRWKVLAYRLNFRLAQRVVVSSRSQAETWSEFFALSPRPPQILPCTIDCDFYQPRRSGTSLTGEYILSIGRDTGRDFPTLVEATADTGMNLKLVTLPYLLSGIDLNLSYLQVLEQVSYEELFELYAGAKFVVVPLKGQTTHPSGIRALFEAMVLEKAVICSRSPVLEEYFEEGQGVMYVEPENILQLREAIRGLARSETTASRLGQIGRRTVLQKYDMQALTNGLEGFLRDIARKEVGAVQ